MSSSNTLDELRQDLAEYEQLFNTAKRQKVKDSLSKEVDSLRRDILQLETRAAKQAAKEQNNASGAGGHQQGYLDKITNYAWDQSDKFMKLYLTLDNLGAVTDQDIQANFTNRSVTVSVKFPEKTSQLHINRLCEEIVPDGCYYKKKSDYVLVMLKKVDVGKTWPWVTEREKKSKEKDKPKFDDKEDPSAGITNMLKNMYDEGDDEMKRQISKAFYESQMKQGSGPGPADFGAL